MTNSKFRVVARWAWLPLLAIVLLLLALLQNLRNSAQALRAATEAADRQVSALQAQVAKHKPRATEVVAASAPATPKETTKKAPPPPGALQSYSDWNVMSDPEFGPPVVRRHRRYAMGNYRQAIEALNMSREEAGKLKQLVAARWNAAADASDIIQRMGEDSADLRRKAVEAAGAEGDRAIKEFVGEDAYQAFSAAKELSFHKTVNWPLFTALWDAGVPVTPSQEDAYARALQQVNSQFPTPAGRGPADPETGLSQADLMLLQAIGSFLSPEQVQIIRTEKIQDARLGVLKRMKESRKGAR